ncbi:hypothetical protein GYB22_02325 [bacterium]|nr:hypothetical protein [bacterium]
MKKNRMTLLLALFILGLYSCMNTYKEYPLAYEKGYSVIRLFKDRSFMTYETNFPDSLKKQGILRGKCAGFVGYWIGNSNNGDTVYLHHIPERAYIFQIRNDSFLEIGYLHNGESIFKNSEK